MLGGRTGLVGDNSAVVLVITPPGPKPPITLKVKPKPSGEFGTAFTSTLIPGTYKIRATAPDGKGTAEISFSIVPAGVVSAEVGHAVDALTAAVIEEVTQVRAGVTGLPASPARTEATAKVAQLEAQVAKLPAQTALIRAEVGKLLAARAKIPEPVPSWDEFQAEMQEWVTTAKTTTSHLSTEPPTGSAGSRQCAQIDDLVEDLTSISEAIGVLQVTQGKQQRIR